MAARIDWDGLFGQGGYRWASYDQVDGVVSGPLGESVDGSGAFAAAPGGR